MKNGAAKEGIAFIVGTELGLRDLLKEQDAAPMLDGIIATGAVYASLQNAKDDVLWFRGDDKKSGRKHVFRSRMFNYEGEPAGLFMAIAPESADIKTLRIILNFAASCLEAMLTASAKRMMTTGIHTAVIQQSYEELLQTNKMLVASEKNYKKLSDTLEEKVRQRTEELKSAHTRLLNQEKMAAIGQLAAGIAHEINNPIGFIYSNLNTFLKYSNNMKEMIEFYRKAALRSMDDEPSEALYKKLKMDFILSDIYDLIKQSIDGAERIKVITANLKGFSHIDEISDRLININEELDNTLNVLSHEIKQRNVVIAKDYQKIDSFYGNPGAVCQVFLNILLNALQSRDAIESMGQLQIKIKTVQEGEKILISIADNGPGIPENIRGRIFEPFFTTKDVGKGSGMGLATAYETVTGYGGTIEVTSEEGKGTEFVIMFPIRNK